MNGLKVVCFDLSGILKTVKAAPSRGGAVFVLVPGYVSYVYLKTIKILRRKKNVLI